MCYFYNPLFFYKKQKVITVLLKNKASVKIKDVQRLSNLFWRLSNLFYISPRVTKLSRSMYFENNMKSEYKYLLISFSCLPFPSPVSSNLNYCQ